MLPNQLVIGHIAVERSDQVIAITPGLRNIRVAFAAMRLAIAHEVHPMARPALSEALGSQQAINQGSVGILSTVVREALDILERRRQACQIKRKPANQGSSVGRRSGGEALSFQFGEHESVERVEGPLSVLDGRRR